MPWSTPDLDNLIDRAKILISKFYPKIKLTAIVMISTEEEIVNEIIEEKSKEDVPEKVIQRIRRLKSVIDGRFFKNYNEIWLVQKRGEKLGTLIHEYLHSIQICYSNRERIEEYLTYKLTSDPREMLIARIQEWSEIEKSIELKAIINQLVVNKDCEDF